MAFFPSSSLSQWLVPRSQNGTFLSMWKQALYTKRVCVRAYATKHRFLIMRSLACPIYGNHFSPRGWKTQDAGKREAKAEERSIRHRETRSVGYLLFIDLMMQEKHLKLALNWRNTSSVFFHLKVRKEWKRI